MYKLNFFGDPYDAGYKYGVSSYKRNIKIKDMIELSEMNYSFDEESIALYKEYYPQVLEEIKGIAQGQKFSYEALAAYIFSNSPTFSDDRSFCFSIIDDNNIILGRNCNVVATSNEILKSCSYNLHGGYSFLGNTAALVQMGDGINEWGLSVALSSIPSKPSQPGFNGGMLVRYLLEKCKNTYEAVDMVKKLPIASKQGLIIIDSWKKGVLLEVNGGKISDRAIDTRSPFLLSANTFNNTPMKKYRSRGAEALLLQERFTRLEAKLQSQLENKFKSNHEDYLCFAFQFLSEAQDFMEGASRDKKYQTLWSSVYDVKNMSIYRAERNPIKWKYKEDHRLKIMHDSTKLYEFNEK